MNIVDAVAREQAIDPTESFCVTAPAGSGKTELLIQRYLALLATVARPEQVLAITFTRKAAAEMRERVLEALQQAAIDTPVNSEHGQRTRTLASAALAADHRHQWQLTRNIARINIKTIDSFCSVLTRQMPILSRFGGQAAVVDNAGDLYAEAVEGLLELLESSHPVAEDLAALMLHFDNNWQRLSELLTTMLGRRDQWGGAVAGGSDADAAEAALIATVHSVVEEALTHLSAAFSPYASQLLELQRYACANLGEPEPDAIPGVGAESLPQWRAWRQLLMTQDAAGKWRAKLDKRGGFPAGKGEAATRKAQMMEIIGFLREVDGLAEALAGVVNLPEPDAHSQSWRLVVHIRRILPILAAQLLLVFQRHGQVDHSQIALSALQALGDDEAPTELALKLDYQLEHILVDEFQDTANNQFELVRRLTRGWGSHNALDPQNPRTLLIVGDGMQSIYGFRDANVGLFLKAREEGFNGVTLRHLALRSNFRSSAGIVSWVNGTFDQAFPAQEDASRGQIRFASAEPVKPQGEGQTVTLKGFIGEQASEREIAAICDWVHSGVNSTKCKSIAVLARTRSHLQAVIEEFKARGIRYSAQDIDSLARSGVVIDLMSLCRALANPADRVAWLALLRAPWCGLGLADLHVLGSYGGVSAGDSVIQSLWSDPALVEALSEDGRNRVAHLSGALAQAQARRDRLPLRAWIETLWLELGGAATMAADGQLADAERFFQLLEQAEGEGEGLSPVWLESRLVKLFVQVQDPTSKVQLMTLHKAKGLEFDWVAIPSLQKLTRGDNRPLLLWDEYNGQKGQEGFLMAADDHSETNSPSLYNWLRTRRAAKEQLETTRLLYVGATRAVDKLLLTAIPRWDEKKAVFKSPSSRSLLASIWPVFERDMQLDESLTPAGVEDARSDARPIVRLTRDTVLQLIQPAPAAEAARKGEVAPTRPRPPANALDRHVGTAVHFALEQLTLGAELPAAPAQMQLRRWEMLLSELGVTGHDLPEASARVEAAVRTVLADERGRWILDPSHQGASELALTAVDEAGVPFDVVIDRTFVDSATGTRWIVDYKNSAPEEGEALEHFCAREEATYRAQLERYRQVLLARGEQAHCALYFTALGHFHPLS